MYEVHDYCWYHTNFFRAWQLYWFLGTVRNLHCLACFDQATAVCNLNHHGCRSMSKHPLLMNMLSFMYNYRQRKVKQILTDSNVAGGARLSIGWVIVGLFELRRGKSKVGHQAASELQESISFSVASNSFAVIKPIQDDYCQAVFWLTYDLRLCS